MLLPKKGEKDITIVLCGEAGQGIQTVEDLLVRMFKRTGYHVYSFKEYMSRIRGGSNSTLIRFSDRPVRSYVSRMDVLVPISKGAIAHLQDRISDDTIVLVDEDLIGDDRPDKGISLNVKVQRTAVDAGGKVMMNVVAAGILSGMFGVERTLAVDLIKETFSRKSEEVVSKNISALDRGFEMGLELKKSLELEMGIAPRRDTRPSSLMGGAEAISLGALAGGCNFISSYPMSPSTGVLTFLSKVQKEFGLISEQAEDEISAINMAIGAWYAGARAMVTTSGGGFALMTEGISLAGILESPMVVHIAQRPGPATGLPTRTEQADLLMTLFSGHGEFPRIIYAPGDMEEGLELSAKAFDMADRFQVPVFILSDQYFVDSNYDLDEPESPPNVKGHIVRTGPDYERYEDTPSGVSPRGIPFFGEGIVCVDSDEHTKDGHITEDLIQRVSIQNKRMRKSNELGPFSVPPSLIGPSDHRVLVVGWGSTKAVMLEAMERTGREDMAVLHLSQVYPLHPDVGRIISEARTVIFVENNATSQLRRLISMELGMDKGSSILQYNGMPFAVDELAQRLKEALEGPREAI